MGTQPGQHSNMRFYIVLITIVIGAIFFLLLMNQNSNGNGFSLTSAVIGDKKGAAEELASSPDEEETFFGNSKATETKAANANELEKVFGQELEKSSHEIEFKLSLDQAPSLRQKVKIKETTLQFTDLNARIKVNGDDLDLSNLEKVTLSINGFSGRVDLNELDFSLNGRAKSIKVNDMTLSSKGELNLSIESLSYQQASLEEIEAENTLVFTDGKGQLEVGDKFNYHLEEDLLRIYYFNGRIVVSREGGISTEIEGITQGITGRGALLNFNLR